ncbi:MAG: sensor histidine kinase, partial [Pseudomonadota bacterium]|nr:sensor histidine kinase [Pseudomonadota bacterium]
PEQIFPVRLAAARRRDLQKALAAEGVSRHEYRIDGAAVMNASADGDPVVNASAGSTAAMKALPRTWDARFVPLAAAPGQPPDQLLLVATDVTEQRAAQEARLEAAVAQREMLVKEVHHRIKNNLQGVAGLLQRIAERKPEVAPAIAEVVGQVQAIAQVYGLQVGGEGPLRLVGVVEAITASVQRNFGRPIRCCVVGSMRGEWALPESEAIPIALTLNELLTNAVKHSAGGAGTGDSTGDIDCEVTCADDGVTVAISNAGRLPAAFSLARIPGGASGLGLVRALLPRRHAELSIEQAGDRVVAAVSLRPKVLARIEPGVSKTIRDDATSGRKEKAL